MKPFFFLFYVSFVVPLASTNYLRVNLLIEISDARVFSGSFIYVENCSFVGLLLTKNTTQVLGEPDLQTGPGSYASLHTPLHFTSLRSVGPSPRLKILLILWCFPFNLFEGWFFVYNLDSS